MKLNNVILFSFLFFIFSSCDDSKEDTLVLSATIDGSPWNGITDSAYVEPILSQFDFLIGAHFHGEGNGLERFDLTIETLAGPRPINMAFGDSGLAPWIELERDGSLYLTQFGSGNLELAEVHDDLYGSYSTRGSFSVVLYNKNDSNDSISVTNGKFFAKDKY